MEGDIIDISKGGCLIIIEKAKIKVKKKLVFQVGDEISISFQFPRVENKLTVAGKQKTLRQGKESVAIGIQFYKKYQHLSHHY